MVDQVSRARVWAEQSSGGTLVCVADGPQYDEYLRRGSVAGGTHAILHSREDGEAVIARLREHLAAAELP